MRNIALLLTFTITSVLSLAASSVPDTNENNITTLKATVSIDEFFINTNVFLGKYISDGKVDYAAIKSEGITVKKLYTAIGNMNLTDADKNTKTAFYLNAYNIIVIQSVITNLPIAKPTDVTGFFDGTKHNVAGVNLTLNELENTKLRPDARVHFALVCAAKGCPKISSEAFIPEKVEAQLNSLTKKALNDNTFIKVDDTKNIVQISKIFDWYGVDFVKSAGSAMAYINSYRDVKIPDNYKVEFYEYNWNLNSK